MDRNRDARRMTMAAANGLPRRRQRSSGLRDSPEEDGTMELQETARLRDRKKDRDRDRDRDRERERDRERDRLNRSKRRRNGGGGAERDESSEESVNDEEDDEDEEAAGGASLRMLPPLNPSPASGAMSMAAISASSSLMNTHHNHNHHHHHHQHHIHSNQNNNSNNNIISHSSNNNNNSNNNYSHHQLQHQRKSFPPPSKNFRQPPPAVAVATLKGADEMIGVSVPRKARSVSTKRSHEWSSSAIGIVSDHSHRQASTSPVRQSLPTSVSSASPAPVSPPSSSNASVRRKLKPNGGPKLRQPKPPPPPSSSKSSSAAQDEIEIEIAEVLYGMMTQPQGPAKQETMVNNDISNHNKSSGDAKSRVSSPISGYQYGAPQPPNRPSQLPGGDSAVPAWAFCVAAPKRKKPRLVKYDGKYEDGKPSYLPFQNNSSSSSPKIPTDQLAKTDSSSATHEKNLGSAPENGGIASDTAQSHSPSSESQPEPVKLENSLVSDSKPVANKSEGRDLSTNKEDPQSPKKESSSLRLDDKRETATTSKLNSTTSEIESQREDKFQIDLMAPPPSRSSPERDGETDFVATDAKPMAKDTETELKPVIKEDTANALKLGRELQPEHEIAEPEKAKTAITCSTVEDSESKKLPAVNVKERNIDLQLDLEKTDNTGSRDGANANKLHHQQNHHSFPRHHQPQPQTQQNNHDKTAQSGALPMPTMSMATWPGGLPPMGYMTPLQGVVSMDGTGVSSAPAIQPPPYIFNQPRPKRCATHCYIARSISLHQQIARMSSFWPAAAGVPPGAGPASVYGGKPCNLNIMPSAADRGMNQDSKAHHNHVGKDKPSQAAPTGSVESAQRKQIVLQQALPHGAPPNLMQGPAIIFPLSQQQAVAAAAASVRPPGPAKTLPAAGNATGSNVVTGGSQAMTYNYPNMGGSEAAAAAPQYLAINAYSFPIPAHVGAPPAYRGGPHPQAMPFFNGSFYPTFHPSQLQQQPPTAQQHQGGHQNPSMSSGSSSSQKHLQNQTQSHQQRQSQSQSQHANATNGGVSLQGYPTSKNPSAQNQQIQIQMQQQQQQQRHMGRPLESEMGSEESPSTADSRGSRQSMSIYGHGQNFAMHAPPNFALMTPAPITNGEKKNQSQSQPQQPQQQQQSQQQGSKSGGVEPQAFAMSFTMNGAPAAPPGLDMASLTQQQAMFSDVRQGYQQYMAVAAAQAAAAAAQHKKTTDSGPAAEDERKGGTKGSSSQSIAFSRPDLCEASGSALPGSSVVDSSARTLSLGGSAQPRNSSNVNAQRNHHLQQQQLLQQQQQQQQQLHQQQQQQMIQQFQKHHQQQQQLVAAAASRNKPAAPMNGTTTTTTTTSTAYPDHHHNLAPSMAAKFPNAMSAFPGSPAHSPQWKSSGRSPAPPPQQVPSPSSAASSSLKNLPHSQQSRPQSHHTQISFAAAPPPPSQKPAAGSGNQSPSPPIMVGSPTTSSKAGAGGSNSPRTTPNPASSAGSNKPGQSSQQQQQQVKSHHHHHHNMKPSSPSVGGKNVNSPSILGNPHITSSSSSGKSQQQSQLSKQSLQQAQLFFSSYLPNQSQHNSNSAAVSAAAGSSPYYASASTQRRRPDQPLPPAQGTPSSSGMLSLSNTDASKANKGLPGQAMIHPAQFAAAVQSGNPHQILPAGFPYVHAVPAGVQVKPADQKQQAGE